MAAMRGFMIGRPAQPLPGYVKRALRHTHSAVAIMRGRVGTGVVEGHPMWSTALVHTRPGARRSVGELKFMFVRRRLLSSEGGGKAKPEPAAAAAEPGTELSTMTTGEKIQAAGSWTGFIALFGLGLVCFSYTVYELWPSSTSPNAVFDAAFDQLREDERVLRTFGEKSSLQAYGHDPGRGNEGRRNFVQHREYDGEDGSKRIKVKFNIKGQHSGGIVFAEASNKMDMKKGEWVYLVVQDKRFGSVITVVDNRGSMGAKTDAERSFLQGGKY